MTLGPDGTPVAPDAPPPRAAPGPGAAAPPPAPTPPRPLPPTVAGAPGATGRAGVGSAAARPPGQPVRPGFYPRLAIVVAVGLLFTAMLMALGIWPFTSTPGTSPPATTVPPVDVRGTWHVIVFYHLAFFSETLDVTDEDAATGVFAGTLATPVGAGAMAGKIVGSSVSYTISVGGATETGTGTVGTSGGHTTMTGDFSNSAGGSGTLTATRFGS